MPTIVSIAGTYECTVGFSLECWKCGSNLLVEHSNTGPSVRLKVRPCSRCQERAYREGIKFGEQTKRRQILFRSFKGVL